MSRDASNPPRGTRKQKSDDTECDPHDQPRQPQQPPQTQDPWPIDGYPQGPGDCTCKPPQTPTPKRCHDDDTPKANPKNTDCCEQLMQVLRCIPGMNERCFEFRKPKQTAKVKLANLCCALPVAERIGPILMLILRRYRDGVTPGNTFEAKLQGVLGGMSGKHRAALETALNAYDGFKKGARECAFETRFDDWPNDEPLDPGFLARNIVGEFLAVGHMIRFGPEPFPPPLTGSVRPWEQSIPQPGEPGNFAKITAPWPWICAISPTANKAVDTITDWFRNESACVPGNIPRGTIKYFPHEFSWACTTAVDSSGTATVNCTNETPSGPSGGFGFAECPGGLDYRVTDKGTGKQVCLVIPAVDPGTEVGLRGLNFFSPNAKVHVRKVDAPPFQDIPLIPLSDWQPDTGAAAGKATCEVKDHAFFVMPDHVSDGLNDIPIPPGRYAVQLVVPNDVNFAVAGGGPPPTEFLSNEVLIDLQPSANIRFQILTDEAFCFEETDGLGSDEPWFRALTATIELPKGETKIPFPAINAIDIMNTDDVDSGEWISFPGASLFNDKLGRKVFTAAVIGLEVDSESAARQQIDDFWDAYNEYLNNVFVHLGASTDAGVLGAEAEASLKAGAISAGAWVSGAILAAILAAGFLYALWAPADPIGLDTFVFTSRQLFERTDTNFAHVPAGDDFLRVRELRTSSEPLGKKLDSGGTQATYSERRHYRSTAEDSHYGLVYRFKRI